jgi:hypothetical protein
VTHFVGVQNDITELKPYQTELADVLGLVQA